MAVFWSILMPPPLGEQVSPKCWCLCIKLQAVTLNKSISSNSLPWLSLISHAYYIFYIHDILLLGRGNSSVVERIHKIWADYIWEVHSSIVLYKYDLECHWLSKEHKLTSEQWILNCLITRCVWKFWTAGSIVQHCNIWENVIIFVTRNNKCMKQTVVLI